MGSVYTKHPCPRAVLAKSRLCFFQYGPSSTNVLGTHWPGKKEKKTSKIYNSHRLSDWIGLSMVRLYFPLNSHYRGKGFYGSNDPTNSVKALKNRGSSPKGEISIPPGPPGRLPLRSTIATPTALWYRQSNCQQSAAELLQLRLQTSGTDCQLTSSLQIHCQLFVDC